MVGAWPVVTSVLLASSLPTSKKYLYWRLALTGPICLTCTCKYTVENTGSPCVCQCWAGPHWWWQHCQSSPWVSYPSLSRLPLLQQSQLSGSQTPSWRHPQGLHIITIYCIILAHMHMCVPSINTVLHKRTSCSIHVYTCNCHNMHVRHWHTYRNASLRNTCTCIKEGMGDT